MKESYPTLMSTGNNMTFLALCRVLLLVVMIV